MKSALFLMVLLLAGATFAADQSAPVKYYDSGFESSAFFRAVTKDLATAEYGAGVGLSYYFNQNFGVGTEVSGEDVEGLLVEQFEARGLWRLAFGRAALVNFAGYAHDFNRELSGFTLGGGPEYRFTPNLGVYVEIGLVKWLNQDVDTAPAATAKAGIRVAF